MQFRATRDAFLRHQVFSRFYAFLHLLLLLGWVTKNAGKAAGSNAWLHHHLLLWQQQQHHLKYPHGLRHDCHRHRHIVHNDTGKVQWMGMNGKQRGGQKFHEKMNEKGGDSSFKMWFLSQFVSKQIIQSRSRLQPSFMSINFPPRININCHQVKRRR